MPLSNLDHQKIYYYVICVMAFFVLMWGAIDLASSSIGLISLRSSATSEVAAEETTRSVEVDKAEQDFDSYYQTKMLADRFWDSLARVLIAGTIFGYCRLKVAKMETKA